MCYVPKQGATLSLQHFKKSAVPTLTITFQLCKQRPRNSSRDGDEAKSEDLVRESCSACCQLQVTIPPTLSIPQQWEQRTTFVNLPKGNSLKEMSQDGEGHSNWYLTHVLKA